MSARARLLFCGIAGLALVTVLFYITPMIMLTASIPCRVRHAL